MLRKPFRPSLSSGFSVPYFAHVHFSPDGGEGGGGGSGGGADTKKPDPITTEELTKKHGGAEAALMYAVGKMNEFREDNFRQREEIRGITSRIPAEGSRVISAADAAVLDEYRALGSAESIRKKVTERDEFEARVKEADRDGELRNVARMAGDWDFDVLKRVAHNDQFVTVEEKDEKGNTVKGEDGHPKKAIHVKGEGDKSTPIAEAYKSYLPSLAPRKKEEESTPSREFKRSENGSADAVEKLPPLFH